jgi:multidrug resistance efflux pump
MIKYYAPSSQFLSRSLSAISVLLFFGLPLLSGCSAMSKATPPPETPIRLNAGAAAEARVIPIRSSILSFAAIGKVESIQAAEGSSVQKGDPIARLEGSEKAGAAVAAADLQVASAQKALDDLNEKAKVAAADAEMAVALAEQELKDAKEKRDDLNYKRVNQYMLENIQSQLTIAEKAVEDAEDTFSYVQDRPEDDADRARALMYLSQARLARDQIKRNLEYAEGPPASQDIAEADARVSKAQAALDDAKRTFERRKSGPDPKDLVIAEANLTNTKAQAQAARSAQNDLQLTAPFAGTIIVNSLEVGELASAGQVMLGDTSAWQVETTDLKEVDIVGIAAGQAVKVTFDAIPDLEMKGTVNRIKGYGVTVRGDNTYTVTIDLQGSDPRVLWNMTARVTFPESTLIQETPQS